MSLTFDVSRLKTDKDTLKSRRPKAKKENIDQWERLLEVTFAGHYPCSEVGGREQWAWLNQDYKIPISGISISSLCPPSNVKPKHIQ